MSISRTLTLFVLVLAAGCAAMPDEPVSAPGRGQLTLDILPNPIVAKQIRGQVYEFPFEVSLREIGGSAVQIEAIRINVVYGALPVFSQVYGPEELERRGYPSRVPAGGNLQYRFNPQREVPTDDLFGRVRAEIRVEGTDASGNPTSASTTVSLRRR